MKAISIDDLKTKEDVIKYLEELKQDKGTYYFLSAFYGTFSNYEKIVWKLWNKVYNLKIKESSVQQEQTITKEENPDSKTYSNKEIHKVVEKIDEILDVKQSESYKEESNNNQKKMAYKITERLRNNLIDALRENINKKGKVKNDKYIKDGTEVTIKDVVELTEQYVAVTDNNGIVYVDYENVIIKEINQWEDIELGGWDGKIGEYIFTIKEDGKVNVNSKELVTSFYLPELLDIVGYGYDEEYVRKYILRAVFKTEYNQRKERIQKRMYGLEQEIYKYDDLIDKCDEEQNELYKMMIREK